MKYFAAFAFIFAVSVKANSWVRREYKIEATSPNYIMSNCKPWLENCVN